MRYRRSGVANDRSIGLTVGQAHQVRWIFTGSQSIDQRLKNDLAMAAHDIVDVTRAQRHVVVLSWKIAAPDDLELRMAVLELAAHRYGVGQLWSRHDRHTQHVRAVAHQAVERVERVEIEVAVDDGVVVTAFQESAQCQQRQRHDWLAACRTGRVIQNQHAGETW